MDAWAAVIIVAAAVLLIAGLVVIATRVRRRGSAGPAIGAAMAAYDEAMHSTAHSAFVEQQQQNDRRVVVPADGPDQSRREPPKR